MLSAVPAHSLQSTDFNFVSANESESTSAIVSMDDTVDDMDEDKALIEAIHQEFQQWASFHSLYLISL